MNRPRDLEPWETGHGRPDPVLLAARISGKGASDTSFSLRPVGLFSRLRHLGSLDDWIGSAALLLLIVLTLRGESPQELLHHLKQRARQPADTVFSSPHLVQPRNGGLFHVHQP